MKIRLALMGASLTLPFLVLPAGTRVSTAKTAQKKEASTEKYYTVIKSMPEYERVCRARHPKIIVYNSSECTACDAMEPGLNECAKKYTQTKFYTVNALDKAFKGIQEKVNIKAYPTTHFIKPGAKPRVERGSMSADELDGICYHFVHGKSRPYTPKAPPSEIKKSLEEKVD